MGYRRRGQAGSDDTGQTDETAQTDEAAPSADDTAPPPEDTDVPLVFRGAVVPPGMAPPPFAEPLGQQETQTGPSGRTYQFTQDQETPVDPRDVRYFLDHPSLTFELAPRDDTAPPDETQPSPRRTAPPAAGPLQQ